MNRKYVKNIRKKVDLNKKKKKTHICHMYIFYNLNLFG